MIANFFRNTTEYLFETLIAEFSEISCIICWTFISRNISEFLKIFSKSVTILAEENQKNRNFFGFVFLVFVQSIILLIPILPDKSTSVCFFQANTVYINFGKKSLLNLYLLYLFKYDKIEDKNKSVNKQKTEKAKVKRSGPVFFMNKIYNKCECSSVSELSAH